MQGKSMKSISGISGWWFATCLMTFHHIGNVIIPTDELHHFSEGLAQPPTRFINETSTIKKK
jgi:hypothetical protein